MKTKICDFCSKIPDGTYIDDIVELSYYRHGVFTGKKVIDICSVCFKRLQEFVRDNDKKLTPNQE